MCGFVAQWREEFLASIWTSGLAECHLWVRLGHVDHLLGARMRDRCSSLSGPISVRSDRGSLGPHADILHSNKSTQTDAPPLPFSAIGRSLRSVGLFRQRQ